MGRGRQKAKQTKVARELKYHSSSIDVTALQRELSGEPTSDRLAVDDAVDDDDDDLDEEVDDGDPYSGSYGDDAATADGYTSARYTKGGGEPSAGYASQRRR